jgi:hypothetical protein
LELIVIFDWDTIEHAKAYVGMKVTENPKLVSEREGGGGPKLANIFVDEMEPLDS